MWKQVLLIGIGGGIGSIFRFLFTWIISKSRLGWNTTFPTATFIINLFGCFLLGLFAGIYFRNNGSCVHMKALFITGFCGGFTTFSTFSMENLQLFQYGHYQTLCLYTLASIIIGFTAIWIGFALFK